MDWNEVARWADRIFNTTLFTLSGQAVTTITLIAFFAIIGLSFWVARVLGIAAARAFALRGVSDPGIIGTTRRLIYYVVFLIGLALALQNIGFNLGALFAAGAFFAVALGFGMQHVAQNFVSGVLLLAERTIKNGDILELEDRVVRVTRMGLRVTVARTRDEEDLIIPNSKLAENIITNYTLRDAEYRLRAPVGVTYDSDMALVMRTLQQAAEALPFRMKERAPNVLLTEFGEHSVNFEVHIWVTDPWVARRWMSELNQAIWWALKEADVTIAFPQLDVHFDPAVTRTIEKWRPGD